MAHAGTTRKSFTGSIVLRTLFSVCMTGTIVGRAFAQQATVMEPSEGAAIAASVQTTSDAKANKIVANLLRNSSYKAVTMSAAGEKAHMAGLEVRPASNGAKPDYRPGVFRTQLRMFIPAGGLGSIKPPSRQQIAKNQADSIPPQSAMPWNTPASLDCIYNLLPSVPIKGQSPGCTPDNSQINVSGGSGAIAVVDAFDTPATTDDLKNFSAQFGLAQADFQIVYASGREPQSSFSAPTSGWDIESELDVQWAHAMAPNAKIYLVEADSDATDDLFAAVDVATKLVQQSGGGEVSMSFGSQEYPGEIADDAHFSEKAGVVYTTGAGDTNIVSYPAASTHVISVGGTTLLRDQNNLFLNEVVWNDIDNDDLGDSGTGGGPSYFITRPNYQASVAGVVSSTRGTPDVAFNAGLASGVWVLAYGYWNVVGGTSLGSPAIAGIINTSTTLAKTIRQNSTQAELIGMYGNIATPPATPVYRDIVTGTCGTELFPPATPVNLGALPGYDMCSGVGSPQGYIGLGAPAGAAHPALQLPNIAEGLGGVGGTISITPVSTK